MIGETGERKSAVATPDGKSRKKKKKLCLKSAVGIQAVYNELLHCVWATGLFVQLDNQAGSDIFT